MTQKIKKAYNIINQEPINNKCSCKNITRGGFIDNSSADEISDIHTIRKTKTKTKIKKRKGVIYPQKINRRKPALISILNNKEKINKPDNNTEIISKCIKKSIKYNEIDILQLNIKYPHIKLKRCSDKIHEKSEKRINKFYDNTAERFAKFSENILYKNAVSEYLNAVKISEQDNNNYLGFYFKPFGAVLNFEVSYNKNNYLCIYFDANIYTGKGRGYIKRKGHIWNLHSGSLISSNQFINLGGDNKKMICTHICDIIKNQTERGEERYINTGIKTVRKYFNKKNMFITDRGYNFFFPQSSLSPAESGIVSFEYIPQ